jgi:outer membrane protein assembly factor BamE (lipoprotein component of BamABCDE complex)
MQSIEIKLTKQIDVNRDTFAEETWYYVSKDGLSNKAFREEEKAIQYYNALVDFHKKYGKVAPMETVLKEITIKPE